MNLIKSAFELSATRSLAGSEPFQIQRLGEAMKAPATRFIESWSVDDVYGRFGTAGIDGQAWLIDQITERDRSAFVAVYANCVVGLLDHIYAQGAIHMGIVVDTHFRRLSIGTTLISALLHAKFPLQQVAAECQIDNRPAVALLRGSRFELVSVERPEMIWRHA